MTLAVLQHWLSIHLATLDGLDGLPMAVVTNKARVVTMAVLEALGVAQRFAFVYAGGDGPLKRALGVAADAMWVVGDGPQDVLSARAAGSPAIAVLGGFGSEARLREARPDVVLASLDDLPALLADEA